MAGACWRARLDALGRLGHDFQRPEIGLDVIRLSDRDPTLIE
jgi:hypothetical protein